MTGFCRRDELERSLAANPANPDAWVELARIERERRQPGAALAAANNALVLDESSDAALFEKGAALLALGAFEQAASVFTTLLATRPLDTDALAALGRAYVGANRLDVAARVWEQAIHLGGAEVSLLEDLAACYQRLGELDHVADTWTRVLALDPQHPEALHHMSALGRRSPRHRASREYVEKLFDDFAETFDDSLQSLNYSGPQQLAETVAACLGHPVVRRNVLDLGCGTGAMAVHVKAWCERLDGVDLSARMLEKARERGLYDALHRADMVEFCSRQCAACDLVLAADSVNYLGRLDELFRGVRHTLRPDGYFGFFVEQMPDGGCEQGYVLAPHGRFLHHDHYVRDGLIAEGFEVERQDPGVVIRTEAGKPVEACLFVARRAC